MLTDSQKTINKEKYQKIKNQVYKCEKCNKNIKKISRSNHKKRCQ